MSRRTFNLGNLEAGFTQRGHFMVTLPGELSQKERQLIEEWLTHNSRANFSSEFDWIEIGGTELDTVWKVTVDIEITASGLVTLRFKASDAHMKEKFRSYIRPDDQVEVMD